MKYLVAHTYIPSESAAVYPRASDYAIRDSSKEAFDFAEKQLADMKETYETEYGQQCITYTDDNDFYLECCGCIDWWHIYFIEKGIIYPSM